MDESDTTLISLEPRKNPFLPHLRELYQHISEIEQDEDYEEDVIYTLQHCLEFEYPDMVFLEDVEELYEAYKSLKALRNQVQFLGKLRQPEQRSPEWYQMREGMITASDIGSVVGDNPYTSANKVFLKKAGLETDVFKGNATTEWGVKYEPFARMMYEQRTGSRVLDFGLLPHYSTFQHQEDYITPITFIGASPDGITEDGMMLEIKCPPTREITGEPPRYYWDQMQVQMECCNLEECDYLECKFLEINDFDDFIYHFNHAAPDQRWIYGMVATKALPTGSKEYSYHYPIVSEDQARTWMEEQRALGSTVTLTECVQYSCVRVPRDREWFRRSLPIIKEFWKRVLDARANPEKYGKPKRERRVVSKASSSCLIHFTADEQEADEERSKHITPEWMTNLVSNNETVSRVDTPTTPTPKATCMIDWDEE